MQGTAASGFEHGRTRAQAVARQVVAKRPWIVVMALVLAFTFLGTRGLWEPDEGRYTNIALTMLDSGDWLDPMRNEDTGHWAKPPVTYWLIAASFWVFGPTAWAARLPSALAYLACIALGWRCARRLVPGAQDSAAVIYATMLMPFCAGQLVTTDFPMAAAQALAVYGFIEYRFGSGRRGWLWLMWAAFALAFMTKGPPALMPVLAILAMRWLAPDGRRIPWPFHAAGALLFLALVSPWFIAVTLGHGGLMQYFLGAELVDRVASDRFGRNGQWYGWAAVYVPTLIVGVTPWVVSAWRWLRALPTSVRGWRDPDLRAHQAQALFVALWVVLPLLVFCLVQSRLPLYVLPIFLPIALAIAAQRQQEDRHQEDRHQEDRHQEDRQQEDRPLAWPWLAMWVALLLALRLAVAHVPSRQDASAWAGAIRERVPGTISEVVFVEDVPRYGLHLYLGAEIETLSLTPVPQPRFNPQYDEPLVRELAETGWEPGVVYVAKQPLWPKLQRIIAGYGYRAQALGSPYQGRVIFEVRPLTPAPTSPAGDAIRNTQRMAKPSS
jgi:4-amino-4-deoxy-L-arabinose transferase-like glycosyltransferase